MTRLGGTYTHKLDLDAVLDSFYVICLSQLNGLKGNGQHVKFVFYFLSFWYVRGTHLLCIIVFSQSWPKRATSETPLRGNMQVAQW